MSGNEEDFQDDGAWGLTSDDEILDDIIDTSYLNFDDQERWLLSLGSRRSSIAVDDLETWLKSDPECLSNDCEDKNSPSKSIDTRTFTRPKKKMGRLSFESITEVTSPTGNDEWNPGVPESRETPIRDFEISWKEKKDYIPSILRPSLPGNCSLSSSTGPESLEAFLNMSQSKGIDSFINLAEPEFGDSLIMNTSHPSFLQTSVTAENYDDVVNGMADSQILTESMMHTSIFNDVADSSSNNPFSGDFTDHSVIEKSDFAPETEEDTLVNSKSPSKFFPNETFNTTPSNCNVKKIDTTYTPSELEDALSNEKISQHQSFVINETFDAECHQNHLSYIVTTESELISPQENNHEVNNEHLESNVAFDSTFQCSPVSGGDQFLNTTYRTQETEDQPRSLNSTYSSNENQYPGSPEKMKTIYENTSENINSPQKTFNTTFKAPLALSNQQPNSMNTTFAAEPEIPSEDVKKPNMDETYDQNSMPPTSLPPNRYQTYRKNPALSRIKSTSGLPSFKKPFLPTFNGIQGRSLENLNAEVKKSQNIQRKLNGPKTFSRLPQSLQKSNPNLISNSQKSETGIRMSSFGFNRPKVLRNGDPTLVSKIGSLGKLKSGSDQRLEGPASLTGGSTESIESTQSAHSAPDLDDRLSACSDSSQGSYCRRTMNLDEMRSMADIQMNNLQKGSTPKPGKCPLENNWMASENDLPSPIEKKNGIILGSRGSSPGSMDSTVKTSSPLLSPSDSLHSLTMTTANHIEDKDIRKLPASPKKKILAPVKPIRNLDNKTGIRPPSTRPLNAASGIPRPASRIPAPRFSRPSMKPALYSDAKKSIL